MASKAMTRFIEETENCPKCLVMSPGDMCKDHIKKFEKFRHNPMKRKVRKFKSQKTIGQCLRCGRTTALTFEHFVSRKIAKKFLLRLIPIRNEEDMKFIYKMCSFMKWRCGGIMVCYNCNLGLEKWKDGVVNEGSHWIEQSNSKAKKDLLSHMWVGDLEENDPSRSYENNINFVPESRLNGKETKNESSF